MKYFTLDQWIADQGIEQSLEDGRPQWERYAEYLKAVQSKLPVEFLPLTSELVIHDARLLSLMVCVELATVEIRLDPGPFTNRNWKELRWVYRGVEAVCFTSDPSKGLIGPHGFGDIGYDEIEVLGGGEFEHRLLFSSGIELAVKFKDFRLEKQ